MLQINDVVKLCETRYRVLDSSKSGYIWFNIDLGKQFPEHIALAEIEDAIHSESLTRVDDPYNYLASQIPEKGSKAQQLRDKRYALIEGLVSDPGIYRRAERGAMVQRVFEEKGTIKKTLYLYLRQYWQRGCTPNALLPDYEKSGGRGKKRIAQKTKFGRPRSIAPGKGAIIDRQVEKMFRIILEKHFLTEMKNSMVFAHRQFEIMYETVYPEVPKEDFPTITQLKYFYDREYTKPDKIQRRSSKNEYNKDIRPLTSTATANVHGPGGRYEIDATIADIYLLSSDRQRVIGRPTVYLVVDVFSRMITGFYVGLEHPSYVAAMLALVNAISDKSKLSHQYDIDISPEDWPSVGLPDAILADRGELLGHQIEHLEHGFKVRIENAPPYRGDAKGIVERKFRSIQADFKPFAPGVVKGTTIKKRGGEDYRLDATLTIREFSTIIVGSILVHNTRSVLTKYDREPDMPDDLPLVPIHIWKWGIQHRSGRLRSASEERIRLALLPRKKATLSEYGVRCFGAYYTSSELLASGWLHRTAQKRPGPYMAAYDPVNMDTIYLFLDTKKSEYWECSLTDRSRAYRGKTLWEMRRSQKKQRQTAASSKVLEREGRRNLDELIQETIENAERLRPSSFGTTKAEVVTGIRENRNKALELERKKRRSEVMPQSAATNAEIIPFDNSPEDGAFPDLTDILFGDDE